MAEELHVATTNRLKKSGIWYLLHENYRGQEAYSCRQAITVRNRLGSGEHGGIPLWAELKSEIGLARNNITLEEVPYAAHTRGNTVFDKEKIAGHFGWSLKETEFDLLSSERPEDNGSVDPILKSMSDLFGLINPLNADQVFRLVERESHVCSVRQLFDTCLTLHAGRPDTVLTNAGNRRHAFEVKPRELISAVSKEFPSTEIVDIATADPIWLGKGEKHPEKKKEWLRFPPPIGPKIGILTGNSPESGLTLWQDILNDYRSIYRNTADVLMPEVLIHSMPSMGLSMELVEREEIVWELMKKAVVELLKNDCKLVTVACNTTIYFEAQMKRLCTDYGANFVSIAEACLPSILYALNTTKSKEQGIGLIGIGPVVDLDGGYSGYAKYFKQSGIKITPSSGVRLAYQMKNVGINRQKTDKAISEFRNQIKREFTNVDVVVMALTEISLVYRNHIATLSKKRKPSKVFIDPLAELARYLVFLYLKDGLRNSKVCQIPESFDLETELKDVLFEGNTSAPIWPQ